MRWGLAGYAETNFKILSAMFEAYHFAKHDNLAGAAIPSPFRSNELLFPVWSVATQFHFTTLDLGLHHAGLDFYVFYNYYIYSLLI